MPTQHRYLLAFPALLFALAQGCGGAPGAAPEERIQAIFPAPARHLLAAEAAPEAAVLLTSEGFTLHGPRLDAARIGATADLAIEAALPRRGEGVIRFKLPGFEARVTEEGLAGEGRIHGGAVLYARAGGASFFRRGPAGCEEWVLLEEGIPAGDAPALVWHVEGARLAQRGDEVVLKDDQGMDRVAVRAPLAFTRVGMPISLRLEARGSDVALFADPIAEPVLIDPEWKPAGPMNTSRYGHDAVRLKDGRVLVTGESSTADVYDEATDKWTATGPLVNTHFHGTATLLADGRVLVTGGINPATLAEAEIYDPATNKWTATGAMTTPRWYHQATLLPSNKVLVSGGQTGIGSPYLTTAELYDPATGVWTATGSMAAQRTQHFATLLGNGKVIVGGGVASGKQTELYDPAAGTWAAAAPMVTDHFNRPAPVLLPDGTLLVACANVVSGAVGRYDPMANTWSVAGTLAQPRLYCTATSLLNGSALVAGGYYNTYFAEAEIYDPAAKTWAVTKPMNQARSEHSATLLPSGGVLVAGGFDGMAFLTSTEIYTSGATQGSPCAVGGDCTSGSCVGGVCCDTACKGPCQACSVAGGAPKDGTCAPVSGAPCDDGDACTMGDSCKAGACAGTPKTCAPMDECHEAGTCDSKAGQCSNPAKADGSPCAGGSCQGGQCVAGSSSAASSGAGGSSGGGGAGGGGGGEESKGGCGCEIVGARGAGGAWVGLGLLLLSRRRRARRGR